MPGQISIRLSDPVIERLDRLAIERGIRRADLIREVLSIGLESLEDERPESRIVEAIERLEGRISGAFERLPGKVSSALLEVLELTEEDSETPSSPPEKDKQIPSVPSLKPAIEVVEEEVLLSPLSDGPVVLDTAPTSVVSTTLPPLPIEQECRQSVRLSRVLEFKGWAHADLSDALGLDDGEVTDALNGQSELSATRVEARLVHWEYEMQRDGWTP
jgi:predicted DNA-binding protein